MKTITRDILKEAVGVLAILAVLLFVPAVLAGPATWTAGSGAGGGGGTVGPGTVNRIAKFTPNTTSVGNSNTSDDGTTTTIAGSKLVVKNVANSTTAYQFEDLSGSTILNVDTTNREVAITTGATDTGHHSLVVTATAATSGVGRFPVYFNVATDGATTQSAYGMLTSLGAGATSNLGNYVAMVGDNTVAGTGTWNPLNGGQFAGTDESNMGGQFLVESNTIGTNIGALNQAMTGGISIGAVNGVFLANLGGFRVFNVNSLDVGSVNFVTSTKNAGSTTEKHIGVVGQALGGDVNVAGYFGLTATAPTFTTAALIADNGAVAAPVQIWRVNAVDSVQMDATGNLVPFTDNTLTVGSAAKRFSLIRGVVVTSGDLGFDDEECAICHKPLMEDDDVIMHAKARVYPADGGKSYIPTVPVHLGCRVIEVLRHAVGLQ